MNFVLGWVTEAECKLDDDGNPVPGTGKRCFVEIPIPPNLEEGQKRNRDGIKRAVKKAVFEHGLKEYGNRELVVISFRDTFSVDFVEETRTVLLPAENATTGAVDYTPDDPYDEGK